MLHMHLIFIKASGRKQVEVGPMGFDRLADILKFIGSHNPLMTKRIEEAEALARWEKAVGPAVAKHARAIRVQDSILWVEVDHPIWKSELHHRKRQILDLLNARGAPPNASSEILAAIEDILFLDPRPKSRA